MIMTSVLGHIKELDFSQEYSEWARVPCETLFSAPIVFSINQKMRDVADNLVVEARKAQILIIWTDCDREGEYIGHEISEICRQANPKIEVIRARYSALTRAELHRSIQAARPIDMRQVNAARIRSEIDLRAGAAFTRLQTLYFRPRHAELSDKVISYGSCQFPTLGFVVEQYLKRIHFRPELFWFLSLELKSNGREPYTKFAWIRGRLFDKHIVTLLLQNLTNFPARITLIQSKPTSRWRPLPLRTVELQKLGSKWLKLSSDKIMEVAEKLYNRGYISYPRTETDMFEKGFHIFELISKQTGHPKWGYFAKRLVEKREGTEEHLFRWPRSGKHNDKAHPPIHPTKDGSDLEGLEAKVYEFITRRFLACCSEDAKGHETVILAQIREEQFRARGIRIEAQNYLEIYIYESWNDQFVGAFSIGQEIRDPKLLINAGSTTAPRLLTEAELIGSMDTNGIGTDATIHEHIKKIIERRYSVKNKEGRFHPTNLGVSLVLGYDRIGLEESLTKPKLRATLESCLSEICNGTKNDSQVSSLMIDLFSRSFHLTKLKIDLLNDLLSQNQSLGLFNLAPMPESVSNHTETARSSSSNNRLRPEDHEDDFDDGPGSNPPKRGRAAPQAPRKTAAKPKPMESPVTAVANEGRSCLCGETAVRKTVNKEGPNRGRLFYVCSKPMEAACSYFEWDDRQTASTRNNNDRATVEQRSDRFGHDRKCACELVAVRDVTRGGPNKGRVYYKCPKIVQKCSFFQWQDEENSNPNASSSLSRSNPNLTDIKCYKCGQPGHLAPSCPEQKQTSGNQYDAGSRGSAKRGRGTRGRGRS